MILFVIRKIPARKSTFPRHPKSGVGKVQFPSNTPYAGGTCPVLPGRLAFHLRFSPASCTLAMHPGPKASASRCSSAQSPTSSEHIITPSTYFYLFAQLPFLSTHFTYTDTPFPPHYRPREGTFVYLQQIIQHCRFPYLKSF